MSLWWAGLDQGVGLEVAVGSGRLYGSLSADGWGCVPALLVVWPEACLHCSFQAFGWGEVLASKWWPPGQLPPVSSQYLCHQCPCPHSEPQLPSASPGDPQRPAGRSGPGFYEVTAFSLGPGIRETLCAPTRSGVCFSQSCGVPVIKSHWPSKPNALEAPPPMPDPQTVEPDVGLRTLTPVGELLQYNCFPVCGSPTQWVWDLIVSQMHLSYHLIVAFSLSLEVEYLFGRFQYFFIDGCSAVSCDFGVFVRGGERRPFYSAILSQSPILF